MEYLKLSPYEWPQDTVQIPDGQGVMPAIEATNNFISRQEATTYTAEFNYTVDTPTGTRTTQIIATDEDGDFWCEQIFITGYINDGAGVFRSASLLPHATVMITDLRTANVLTYPQGVPLAMFAGDINIFGAFNPIPNGFQPTGTIIQPFCFTRSGGMKLELLLNQSIAAEQPLKLQISFAGWKEYTYASR